MLLSNLLKLIVSWLFLPFPVPCYIILSLKWTLRGLCIGKLFSDILKENGKIWKEVIDKISDIILLVQWISGFIIFIAVIWLLQEKTEVRALRYVILFIGMFLFSSSVSYTQFEFISGGQATDYDLVSRCDEQFVFSLWYASKHLLYGWFSLWMTNLLKSLLSFDWNYQCVDIYDDLISRRVHSSDAEKFAEVCPCPCNGIGWGVIWWV